MTTTQTDDFLTDEFAPAPNDYLSLKIGDTRIRILTKPITGYKYFTTDDKPVISKDKPEGKPTNIKVTDGKREVKKFWAMGVFNYNEKALQIRAPTQSSILSKLRTLAQDTENFGDFRNYDIRINKKGEGLLTKYDITPLKQFTFEYEYINKTAQRLDLKLLYDNGNPFDLMDEKF